MQKSWYKDVAVYQIWTRSFCDGNGDGIGDLYGVYSKLDYIKSLGVDVIWLSPIYPSPNCDYGYDISNYRDINPEFGDLEIFKKVLDGAHERGMKVIMDLVVNHTSVEHEWFKESKKGADNPYHDYYIWRKGKGKDGSKPPNNWLSTFEGCAWEYNEDIAEYYLHVFAKGQPDLNMDNPKVREEVKEILRFWLDMGVDGFREDVITFISKKEGLPNGFPLPVATGIEHYANGPHTYEYLKEFKDDVLSKYDCFIVGESPLVNIKRALKYTTEGDGQVLQMMFSFDHMCADCFMVDYIPRPFNLKKMKKSFSKWQNTINGVGWISIYIENHDHPRIISRYGSEKYHDESGKTLAAMYMLQQGTPYIYQGQEIGMTNIKFDSIDQCKDVASHNAYNTYKKLHFSEKTAMNAVCKGSRENARTPVQWDDSENAGFTTGNPWFKINDNYKQINVNNQENDENSLLNFYRKLLKFRKENLSLLRDGSYHELMKNSSDFFVYERINNDEKLLVIANFKEKPCKFKAPKDYDLEKGELVFYNYEENPVDNNSFTTRPYELRVYKF